MMQIVRSRVQVSIHGSAPAYPSEELCQVADVEARQRLRLVPPHHWLSAAPNSLYRWWPSFPGRRCTCLEQSAWSCHFRTFRSSPPVPS